MFGKHKIGTLISITNEGGHEKLTEHSDNQIPGPGTYLPKHNEAVKSVKFGSEKRQGLADRHADKTPGPNVYNPTQSIKFVTKSSPSISFGVGKQRP